MSSITLTVLILYLLLPLFQMIRSFCTGFMAGFNATDPEYTVDYFSFFNSLLLLFISIWIIVIAFKLLKSLKTDETPFTEANGRHIRNLAFLLICIDPVNFIFALISNFFSGQGFSDNSVNGTVLAAGLVLYCISLVFRYGCELQQESDETL